LKNKEQNGIIKTAHRIKKTSGHLAKGLIGTFPDSICLLLQRFNFDGRKL
jgi:hypothetical protein